MTKAFSLLILILFACSPVIKQVTTVAEENQYHAGFYLLDPATGKVLADHQGEKYFTPASNTKVLTLFAAKKFLPDPLPSFYYKQEDSLTYVWPTGDPSFLNPVLMDSTNYHWLSMADSLVVSYPYFVDDRFGSGWAWDDFSSSYSPEISAFPIYGNMAVFNKDSISGKLLVSPEFLKDSITIIEGEWFGVERMETANRYEVTIGECDDCERYRPFRLTDKMVTKLLEDTLKTPVHLDTLSIPQDASVLYGMPQDSVLRVMMQDSDNFLAEQILLQAGMMLTDTLDSRIAIDTIQSYLNALLPDTVAWVDGSGLSRYNMVTPRSMVYLWKELLDTVGEERLKQIVAIGGEAGTIEKWYANDPPFVYGKTGTLRHNHNLSGLLITKSGKTLIFAYMHNHYNSGSTPIKEEMEQVLRMVYEKY